MTPSEKSLLLHKLIDGELDEPEKVAAERLLETDPMFRAELESLRKLGDEMRRGFPADLEPPSPDFFNTRIRHQIEEEQYAEANRTNSRGKELPEPRGMRWFAFPWAVAAASLVVAVALGLQDRDTGERGLAWAGPGGQTSVGTTYTPAAVVEADAFFSDAAQATVIRLTGLPRIPSEREIAGHSAASYRPSHVGTPVEIRDRGGRISVAMLSGVPGQPPNFF